MPESAVPDRTGRQRQPASSAAATGAPPRPRRVTVLAGGIGAARFLRGLRACASVAAPLEVTVIGNTGDDITLYGLRICPDLDTVMYTLGGGIDADQGWGRSDETWNALAEVRAYREALGDATAEPGVRPVQSWFGLGDRDVGTHLVRTAMLADGATLSQVTAALCERWQPGVRLLPMSDQPVASHVDIEDTTAPSRRRHLHFQEYWVRLHAEVPAVAVTFDGIEDARPAPGVLEAISSADVVVFPPSNPVVSIGTILAVPGIADAVRETAAPVVGVSPVIAGAPVRGMADKLLPSVGVDTSAAGIALHYGARASGGVIDGWLVDTADAESVGQLEAAGLAALARPLWMTDVPASAAIAGDALALAADLGQR